MIENRDTLLSHGNVAGRKVVLDILEAGLKAPDPYEQTLKVVRREGDKLIVNPELSYTSLPVPLVYDLRQIKNIYVVGGGKAAQKEAEALEDLLGDFITEGQINTKKGDPVLCKKINVTLAGHPIPDEDGVAGAQRILEIEQKAREGDLVFFCTSGGGTALKALPAPGISLKDLQEVYKILYFSCGASMPEANAVRNLLTLVRGKHAKNIRGATVFELQTTESPLYFRGPLFERPNHLNAYEKAIGVLKQYQCWDVVPESVKTYLLKKDPRFLPPTPEEWRQRPYYRFRVAGPELMIEAAREKAESIGFNTAVLATSLNDIEARPVAEVLAHIAEEEEIKGRPLKPPCVLICGGEVVVAIGDTKGTGGRNQEMVLHMAQRISGSRNIVIGSVDSDGTDGPNEYAGGIVDGETIDRVAKFGFNLDAELKEHNSNPVLKALDDLVYTGNTGTNVRDLRVIYVAGQAKL